MLGEKGEGIALRNEAAIGSDDLEFVEIARTDLGQEDFPDPVMIAHRVDPAVPSVEVADHADPVGVRSPDREGDPVDLAEGPRMRAHRFPETAVGALAEEIDILLAENGAIGVGINQRIGHDLAEGEDEAIGKGTLAIGKEKFVEPLAMEALHLDRFTALNGDLDTRREGAENTHHHARTRGVLMKPKKGKRIVMRRAEDQRDLVRIGRASA